jgi:hypothetical protein
MFVDTAKRYLRVAQLAEELHGAEIPFDGNWFVAAGATWT